MEKAGTLKNGSFFSRCTGFLNLYAFTKNKLDNGLFISGVFAARPFAFTAFATMIIDSFSGVREANILKT